MKLFRPGALLALVSILAILSACSAPAGDTSTPTALPTATSVLAHVTNIEPPPNTNTPTPEAPTATPASADATATPVSSGATETPQADETSTTAPASDSRLVYLGTDGVAVMSIYPDGTDSRAITRLDKPAQGSVIYLHTDSKCRYLLYGTTKNQEDYQPSYTLLDLTGGSGARTELGSIAGLPRWSPDGESFTAQALRDDGSPGSIFVYDLDGGGRTDLQAEGTPDFLPDGKRLVYAFKDNVYLLDPSTNTSAQLTHLPNNDQNAWFVAEAHPLPGATGIIFFGGQFKKDGEQVLGAQGNGQQWWQIPASGGDPTPWTEPGGNGIAWYDATPGSNRLAFVDSAHSSACVSVHTLQVMQSSGGSPLVPTQPDLSEKQDGTAATSVEGLAWSPDGEALAFAARPYSCADPGAGRVTGTPEIYVWDLSTEGSLQPHKLADGLYPSWVR